MGDSESSVVVEPGVPALDLREAVVWVAQNFDACVETDERGVARVHWERALEPPPSRVARGYMRVAAQKSVEFFGRLVPRFCGELEEEVTEAYTHDVRQVQQIRSVLKKHVDVAREVEGKERSVARQKELRQRKKSDEVLTAAQGVADGATGSGADGAE
jgi:hypothetical protein